MRFTRFAGLTAPDANESTNVDGGSFITRNPDITDQFLRVGAVTHRHDEHASLADPTAPASGSILTTGGSISNGEAVSISYTLVDIYGGETRPSPAQSFTTLPPTDPPASAFTADVTFGSGILPAGNYYYALTYLDASNGETVLGPAIEVAVDPGTPSAQVTLSGLAGEVDGDTVVAYRLWRSYEGADWHLLTQRSADVFVDGGFDPPDNPASPPEGSDNTTAGANSLVVFIPPASAQAVPGNVAAINVYVSPDGTFQNPCFYEQFAPPGSAGLTFTITDLEVQTGEPPAISRSVPGAGKIFPDTDLVFGLKSPVAAFANLPFGVKGDMRVVQANKHLYGVLTASATTPGGWTDLSSAPGNKPGTNGLTGTALGFGGTIDLINGAEPDAQPIVVPDVNVGDIMLIGIAIYGEQGPGPGANQLIPGWTFLASATDIENAPGGNSCWMSLYTKVATADDAGSIIQPVPAFNSVAWAATLRCYSSKGIAGVTLPELIQPSPTLPPGTYTTISPSGNVLPPLHVAPSGAVQVNFWGVSNYTTTTGYDFDLAFASGGTNPLIAGAEGTHIQTNFPGIAQSKVTMAASEDFTGSAIVGGALQIPGGHTPAVVQIGVTLLPQPAPKTLGVSELAAKHLVNPTSLIEFVASGAASVGVEDRGDGTARVTIGATVGGGGGGGGGSFTAAAVDGSLAPDPGLGGAVGGVTSLEFLNNPAGGIFGPTPEVIDLGGGSALVALLNPPHLASAVGASPSFFTQGFDSAQTSYQGSGNIKVSVQDQGGGSALVLITGVPADGGTATLAGGTVTVTNPSVTSTTRILLTAQDNNSTGALRVSARTPGVGFTITSSNAGDSGLVAYQFGK